MDISTLKKHVTNDYKANQSEHGDWFKKQTLNWLGCLLLVNALFLTACGQNHQILLNAGSADYHHYPDGGARFVSTAFGPDGRLWRIVPEKHHIYVDYSTDLGKSFSSPVVVNQEAQHIKVSGENRPGIVIDHAGRITIIYAAEGEQPIALYFSVSNDHGQSFSIPQLLSDKAAEANSFQGRLAISPAGHIYAFWHDERDRTDWRQLGNSIYYSIIDAQTSKHSAGRKLSDTLCDCCRIASAFDSHEQAVLLARFIYPGGIRDHGLLKMDKNGGVSNAERVTMDQWAIEACPEHGPAIAISDDNRYHIAWFTQGSVRQGLFYAYSTDQGKHFSAPLALGNPEKLPSHPDILAQGQHVMLTWTEFDGHKTQLVLMQSFDGGQTWLNSKTIAETSAETDFPFLVRNNKDFFVSWNSKTEGYHLVPLH